MERSFKTLQEALDAGYRLVNRKTDKDISGFNSFGYDYQNQDGEETVTVWFSEELNSMKKPGCFRPMYPPKFYVTLMYSEYHNLEALSTSQVFANYEKADAWRESYLDKVIGPLSKEDAHTLVNAFNTLCHAAWTPNQTDKEKETNQQLIQTAKETIEQLEQKAKPIEVE
jgi:hypothetical protein